MATIFETQYNRLESILRRKPESIAIGTRLLLRAKGYMDLEVLGLPDCPSTGARILSMAHQLEDQGQRSQDPLVTLRIFEPWSSAYLSTCTASDPVFTGGRVDPLTFRQKEPAVDLLVYPDSPEAPDLWAQAEINDFLSTWLGNLADQGHTEVLDLS